MEGVRDQGGGCDNSLTTVILKTFQNLPGLLSHGKFIHVTNIDVVSLASKVLGYMPRKQICTLY